MTSGVEGLTAAKARWVLTTGKSLEDIDDFMAMNDEGRRVRLQLWKAERWSQDKTAWAKMIDALAAVSQLVVGLEDIVNFARSL